MMNKGLSIFRYIIKDRKYTFILFLFLISCFVCNVCVHYKASFYTGLMYINCYGWYNLFLLVGFFLSSLIIYNKLYNNNFFRIRYKNENIFFNFIFKYIFCLNSLIYFIISILNIISVYFRVNGNFDMSLYADYGIIQLLMYIGFLFIRRYIIFMIVVYLGLLIYSYYNKLISYIYLAVCLVLLITSPESTNIVNSILDFKILFSSYLSLIKYSSFLFEVLMSMLYISINMTFIVYLKKYLIARRYRYD